MQETDCQFNTHITCMKDHLFVLLDLWFYVIVVYPFVYFPLAIVLSVLLQYTDSDYPFGIFKLFLNTDYNFYHVCYA